MENRLVGAIKLSGRDSLNFVNALFRPSIDEIKEHINYINDIDNNIVIRKNKNGFEAEIENLDMSFMDNDIIDNTINIDSELKITVCEDYNDVKSSCIISSNINIEVNHEYKIAEDSIYLTWAA